MEQLFQVILITLVIQLLFVIWNVRQFPKIKRSMSENKQESTPLISVLIPTRNEERNIGDCLNAVLQSDYINIEVLVLNDRSDDRTAEIVKSIAINDVRVRLIEGKELGSGWAGKVFACHQLSSYAKGDWWLFMDADARLSPTCISSTMQFAMKQGRGLITGFPYQKVKTALERLIVPLMTFVVACHLPVKFVRALKDPKFVAAHGAFMFVHRESYLKCGGHEAIANQLVDDVALARRMKEAGEPVTLADVHKLVSMRMYHNGREVWDGYRKNIFPGIGRSSALLLVILTFYSLLYVLPPFILILSTLQYIISPDNAAVAAEWIVWSGVCTLLGMGIKCVVDLRNGQSVWLSVLLPISMTILLVLALDSCRGAYTHQGYQWKGRNYS